MSAPDQLTKRPLCPVCKTNQLTDEELAKAGTDINKKRCYFCLCESLVNMDMIEAVPEPAEYGRPNIKRDEAILLVKQKFFRATPGSIEDIPAASATTTTGAPTSIPQKPILTGGPAPIKFDDNERKTFTAKFGMDPVPKSQPDEITVHGANEDTYIKFVCPVQIDLAEKREIQRLLAGMLEIFGKLLKYGPQFAATLIELQNMSSEMFLGGRR